MTNHYQITSRAGKEFGVWSGASPAAALAAMHRDAGYSKVRAQGGAVIFADADSARVCGGLDSWEVRRIVASE